MVGGSSPSWRTKAVTSFEVIQRALFFVLKIRNIHTLCSESMVNHFFMCSRDEQERAENFGLVMDKAREFGVSDEVFEAYQQSEA